MKRDELKAELTELLAELQKDIGDDYRIEGQNPDDDDTPMMEITIGCNGRNWSYQTGDNSFSGGAYGYADWAVAELTRTCKPEDVAEELVSQFESDEWSFES